MIKNIKLSKKFLSMLSAILLGATPIAANAENTNTDNFTLVKQEMRSESVLDVNEFIEGIKKSLTFLKGYIKYDHLQNDLQSLYYLTNKVYIDENTDQELIDTGVVYETNFNSNEGLYNFMQAYSLINVISDYNQSKIRHTNNINDLIDVSELCYDEHDKKLVHDMFVNYFNAYHNGRFVMDPETGKFNEDYTKVFKQLTTLNAVEGEGNAVELSTGAMWLAQNSIGGGVMQMLRDDMQEDFPRSELDKYFKKAELNKGQWYLRDDISLDLNCLKNELEVEVFNFGQLWKFVYDDVNNNIFKLFLEGSKCK